MEEALNDFAYLPFSEKDWVSLSRQLIALKRRGLAVPFQDAMIACLAIKHDCEVWINDRHFRLMQTALPALRLFRPENDRI